MSNSAVVRVYLASSVVRRLDRLSSITKQSRSGLCVELLLEGLLRRELVQPVVVQAPILEPSLILGDGKVMSEEDARALGLRGEGEK